MYQINDLDEHECCLGSNSDAALMEVPFWLGLKQYRNLKTDEFDGGWNGLMEPRLHGIYGIYRMSLMTMILQA